MALKSGELAADAIDAALEANDVSAGRFAEYGDLLCAAIENMRRLVYAFYDTNFSFGRMLKQYPEMRGRLTDCLIGDLMEDKYGELFSRDLGVCAGARAAGSRAGAGGRLMVHVPTNV